REPRLCEVVRVAVDPEHPVRPAALHRQRIEAAVAADVEHRPPAKVGRQRVAEAAPLDRRIVAEEVIGRRLNAPEIDIVEPRPERLGTAADLVLRHRHQPAFSFMPTSERLCPPTAMVLTEAGSTSILWKASRSRSRAARRAALITSAWLTATTRPPCRRAWTSCRWSTMRRWTSRMLSPPGAHARPRCTFHSVHRGSDRRSV